MGRMRDESPLPGPVAGMILVAAILRDKGRLTAAIVLAVLLQAATIPWAAATPPARRDFVIDWPAIKQAVQVFEPAGRTDFEAKVEELLDRPTPLIRPVPAPYVGIGNPGADFLFAEALLALIKPALTRGDVHKVAALMQVVNKGHSVYAVESTRDFSGCILLSFTLEGSDRDTARERAAAADRGEYMLIVWSRADAPTWCSQRDRYSAHDDGYTRLPTGVGAADATGVWPVGGSDVPRTAIADIQRALANLGYRPGPIDGLMGRRTDGAIRQFQRSQGLEPDGVAGPELRQRLRETGTR